MSFINLCFKNDENKVKLLIKYIGKPKQFKVLANILKLKNISIELKKHLFSFNEPKIINFIIDKHINQEEYYEVLLMSKDARNNNAINMIIAQEDFKLTEKQNINIIELFCHADFWIDNDDISGWSTYFLQDLLIFNKNFLKQINHNIIHKINVSEKDRKKWLINYEEKILSKKIRDF